MFASTYKLLKDLSLVDVGSPTHLSHIEIS